MAQWGPADLVAIKDKEVLRIDVKSLRKNGDRDDWTFARNQYLREGQEDIKLLFVNGNEIGWNRDYFQPFK